MKNVLFNSLARTRLLLMFTIILAASLVNVTIGSPVDTTGIGSLPTTPAELFGKFDLLYSGVLIVGGYLSYIIPGLNLIPKTTYRVLVWAILTGLGFVMFGVDVVSVALTYFMSTSLYDVVLKLFKKTPAVPPDTSLR